MLSKAKNDLITQTGPGSPAGALMRRYWQPAALTEELAGERPVVPVRLMGEDLVLFRDDQGRYGLVGKHCPHRGADMCFGRLEDGGLRCAFHGWLFDVNGKCLEQPAEPEGSRFHEKIRYTAYPCVEKNGIVFAYLGPMKPGGDPPRLPDYDCFTAPDAYAFAFKGLWECNWLQALEVGIDPAHASYLHRFFEDEDPSEGYGQQFRDQAADSEVPMTKVLREYASPRIEVVNTDYGLRILTLRQLNDQSMHVRVTNLAFPNAIVIPMSNDMIITQWHVPIDDTHCWWYAIFSDYRNKVDKKTMREQRLDLMSVPDYVPRLNKSNNYGYDPAEQASQTYTGMGMDINVHDGWAVESLGPIQDRTQEHLGTTDKAIIANRRILMWAIEELGASAGQPELSANGNGGRARTPVAIDAIGAPADWETVWKDADLARRETSDWATDPWS